MKVKGSMTAFLSLIFLLLLSFIGGILEAASLEVSKNYKRANMDLAIHSVFAEFQIDLLEEYGIFALDGTYENGTFSYENIFERLSYYGSGEANQEMEGIQFLTDNGGAAFLEQVSAYMASKVGLDDVQGWSEKTDTWEENEEKEGDYEKENVSVQQELENVLTESEEELPAEDNPMLGVSKIKNVGLLTFLIPNQENISNFQVKLEELPSKRELNVGKGNFRQKESNVLTTFGLNQYLLENFTCFTNENEDGWQYELEYLIAGKASDRQNLESVAERLVAMRFVPNYAHLLSDSVKQMEAQTLAISLCALLTVPAISEIVKHAILLAWAYAESLMDVKSLLANKRVQAIKTAENWQLSIGNLLKVGTDNFQSEGKDMENGQEYKDYLQILLYLSSKEKLAMGALDLIEQNLRVEEGLTFFRVDNCVSKMKVQSQYELRRGIGYTFSTEFYYQ
jgi:hypothetical protein